VQRTKDLKLRLNSWFAASVHSTMETKHKLNHNIFPVRCLYKLNVDDMHRIYAQNGPKWMNTQPPALMPTTITDMVVSATRRWHTWPPCCPNTTSHIAQLDAEYLRAWRMHPADHPTTRNETTPNTTQTEWTEARFTQGLSAQLKNTWRQVAQMHG